MVNDANPICCMVKVRGALSTSFVLFIIVICAIGIFGCFWSILCHWSLFSKKTCFTTMTQGFACFCLCVLALNWNLSNFILATVKRINEHIYVFRSLYRYTTRFSASTALGLRSLRSYFDYTTPVIRRSDATAVVAAAHSMCSHHYRFGRSTNNHVDEPTRANTTLGTVLSFAFRFFLLFRSR